jgi:uncharacterized protein YyaL (SSP411 family)
MVRSILALLVLLAPALSAQAGSRFVADSAGNPVKWEGWGPRALNRAITEKRPIFLMAGYASSFECFRMHREAFLVGEVAETLNTYFVPVLLDRFEYPEVAETYEAIAWSMNQSTGWPILMVLTPSLEPFRASGYLEAGDLNRMLVIDANRWANENATVLAEARQHMMKARAMGNLRAAQKLDGSPDALRKLRPLALRDQLGGGWHRALRDAEGRVPYFEKLTTDQALMAIAHLDAWMLTRDPAFEAEVRATLDAALRDLRQKGGVFDVSQDAHNLVPAQGPEFWNGAFYVWNKDEIEHLLGRETALKVFRLYGMTEATRNILRLEEPALLQDEAVKAGLAKLLDVRQKRPQPFRETNVVSGVNGLMISALARAGAVFGERAYVDAAAFAARAVTSTLWNAKTKSLLHSEGVHALAADYALLVQGLLDLFEASYDARWLELAIALQQRQDQLFWDERASRYASGASVPEILRGLLSDRDGETPAANSVAPVNLLRLSTLTGNEAWRTRSAAYAASLATTPKLVIVTGDLRLKATNDLLRSIHARRDDFRFIVFVPAKGPARERVANLLPYVRALVADPELAIQYECSGGECRRR